MDLEELSRRKRQEVRRKVKGKFARRRTSHAEQRAKAAAKNALLICLPSRRFRRRTLLGPGRDATNCRSAPTRQIFDGSAVVPTPARTTTIRSGSERTIGLLSSSTL